MAKKNKSGVTATRLTGLTCWELVRWLRTNVGVRELRNQGHKTVMGAARWWVADLVADDMADMSRREFANALLDPTPLKTAGDLTAYLSSIAWGDTQSLEECLDAVSTQLAEFWGVR